MAINPLRLKPTEVLRLLNSTPVGTVTGERLLRRHRDAAGMNISDDAGQTVNIFKYAAWLTRRWLERDETPSMSYEERKEAARKRNIALALAGRDIGELPPVAHPGLKAQCRTDFRLFCETYFPETFTSRGAPTT